MLPQQGPDRAAARRRRASAQVKDAEIPVKVARFGAGDIGNLVMVSGAGVLKSSKNAKAAEAFVAFLLGEAAQTYFTKDYCEYPVVSIDANERLVPLAELDEDIVEGPRARPSGRNCHTPVSKCHHS